MTAGTHRAGTEPDERGDRELLQQLLARVDVPSARPGRLARLLDAAVTVAADLELDSVLARTASEARGLVDAEYAAVLLQGGPDGRTVRRVSARRGSQPVVSREASADEAAARGPLEVPLGLRGRPMGHVRVAGPPTGAFSTQDEALVAALAAFAAIVIENSRLYRTTQDRGRWLEAVTHLLTLMSRDPVAGEVDILQTIAEQARWAAGADAAWIAVGSEVDSLRLRAMSGVGIHLDDVRSLSLRHSLSGEVVATGDPVSVRSLSQDPRVKLPTDRSWPEWGPAVVVPFSIDGRAEGTLALAWTPDHEDAFDDVDPGLAAGFAEQTGVALRLAEARRDRDRLDVLESRDRIGRDLHENVVRDLFAVGLGLQGLDRLTEEPQVLARVADAVEEVDTAIRDIRRTVYDLGPTQAMDDVGAELTRVVDRAAAAFGFTTELQLHGPVTTAIPTGVVPGLLAVLTEALSNAGRHGHASRVVVTVVADEHLTLEVRDDGAGFGPGSVESGMANMRDRAAAYFGDLAVTSSPGVGTTVAWRIPLVHDPVPASDVREP